MLAVVADAERDDPRQELGIARDIGDEREHLLVAVRQLARFVVPGQSVRLDARQLRLTRGAHAFEIVAGVIARPGQRRRSALQEALGARDLSISVERLGGHEVDTLSKTRRWLGILY